MTELSIQSNEMFEHKSVRMILSSKITQSLVKTLKSWKEYYFIIMNVYLLFHATI